MIRGEKARYWTGLAVSVLLLGAGACAGGSDGQASDSGPEPFVLGFLPSARAEEIVPDAERLAAFLSERMGRQVDVLVPSAYEPLIEGFRFGHVHAAFLDGGPGWIAHRRTGAEVVLAEQTAGETHYWAEAFVRSDSELQSIEEVIGKRVAFTSRTGSSGFLMPIGWMIANGLLEPAGNELADLEVELQSRFAATVDAGGYQQALEALLEGRVDVAFGAHDAPQRFLSPEDQARVRPLFRFGRIPSHAVLVAAGLPESVVSEFREAMLALNEPANVELLRAIYGVDGLVPTTTQEHLGDFGQALSALPGMEATLLNRQP